MLTPHTIRAPTRAPTRVTQRVCYIHVTYCQTQLNTYGVFTQKVFLYAQINVKSNAIHKQCNQHAKCVKGKPLEDGLTGWGSWVGIMGGDRGWEGYIV